MNDECLRDKYEQAALTGLLAYGYRSGDAAMDVDVCRRANAIAFEMMKQPRLVEQHADGPTCETATPPSALSPSVQRFAEAVEHRQAAEAWDTSVEVPRLLDCALDHWLEVRNAVQETGQQHQAVRRACVDLALLAMAIHDKHLPEDETTADTPGEGSDHAE